MRIRSIGTHPERGPFLRIEKMPARGSTTASKVYENVEKRQVTNHNVRFSWLVRMVIHPSTMAFCRSPTARPHSPPAANPGHLASRSEKGAAGNVPRSAGVPAVTDTACPGW